MQTFFKKRTGASVSKLVNKTDRIRAKQVIVKQGYGVKRSSQRQLKAVKPSVTLNEESQAILNLLETTNTNVILTGRAGTGKSTLIQYFRATTAKNVIALAPTGVAAVNVQGQTIHSFCKFRPGVTLSQVKRLGAQETALIRDLDAIVIDEISMVRADLFDCFERFMRLHGPDSSQPFGGVQIIAVGDLYQLPPIISRDEQEIFSEHYQGPFFFDAHCYQSAEFHKITLTQVYRQLDSEFVDILDAIRINEVTDEHLEQINQCWQANYQDDEFTVNLVSTNYMAERINEAKLNLLASTERKYQGALSGDFNEQSLPTQSQLKLKVGAQVMLLNNDSNGRWINGDLAKVIAMDAASIKVVFNDGTYDDILPYTWERVRFVRSEDGTLGSQVVGSFTQLPIRLAWAVTIHKGQGQTFDRAVIDFGTGTFAAGQAYVALSRCKSLSGLVLKSRLERRHIFIDPRIKFYLENN